MSYKGRDGYSFFSFSNGEQGRLGSECCFLEANDAIKNMKDSMETAISSTDKEMIQLRKNSGDSLKMFKSMNRCLEKVESVNTTLPYEVSSKSPERSTKRHHQGKKELCSPLL